MSNQATADAEIMQVETLLFARAYLYTLFHKILGGVPTAELLECLECEATVDVIDEYAEECPAMAGLVGLIRSMSASDPDGLLDGARDEYTRVFVGPAALPASPYESPYLGSHDMAVFQESTLAVRRVYREHGLRPKRIQRVPDDHVSLMAAYMAIQAKAALEAFRSSDFAGAAGSLRDQGAFAEGHMANWIPVFAKAVRNSRAAESAVMYPQMIEALGAFAAADVTFTVEASYWLEGLEVGVSPSNVMAVILAKAQGAFDRLEGVRLVGLEENELVRI